MAVVQCQHVYACFCGFDFVAQCENSLVGFLRSSALGSVTEMSAQIRKELRFRFRARDRYGSSIGAGACSDAKGELTVGRLIIIRHAETEANVSGVWHGALDAPLTPRGEEQVAATAMRVRALVEEYPIGHFYVSPLPRARRTAAAIAALIEHEPTVEPDLREFDLGAWEGRSFRDLKEKENLWARWAADPSFAPPQGESPLSFGRRVAAVFADLVQRHRSETILVVTHGAVMANLQATWLGEGPADWRNWEAHNCAISIIEQTPAGWTTVCVNDVRHLPAGALNQDGHVAAYQLDDEGMSS